MTELSTPPLERSRKAHALILHAMQEAGTARNIAELMGVSESTVSRIKNEHLADSLTLICHLGFKVVPSEHISVQRDILESVLAVYSRVAGKQELIRALLIGDEL